jgi:hypothetical protein
MDRVGLCGVPSLWVSRDELVREKHWAPETIRERERLDFILKIL